MNVSSTLNVPLCDLDFGSSFGNGGVPETIVYSRMSWTVCSEEPWSCHLEKVAALKSSFRCWRMRWRDCSPTLSLQSMPTSPAFDTHILGDHNFTDINRMINTSAKH